MEFVLMVNLLLVFGNRIDAKNVIIFGVDASNSSHSTNKTQNIYVLGKDFVQGINSTTIYAEKIYTTNFTEQSKKSGMSLQYNGNNGNNHLSII